MKRVAPIVVLLLLAGAGAASAQSIDKVRELYASAAYEEALDAANRLQAQEPTRDAERYRVLCLLALGRDAEAQTAMEGLVAADPFYVLDPAETSPRVQKVFTETRQRLLPDVARRVYADARAALDRKERASAIEQFDTLLRLIDGTQNGPESFADLRVLAAGFLDLSRALPEPAPAPPPAPVAAAAAAAPAASVPETRPVAVRQALPRWVAPDAVSRKTAYSGSIVVHVGRDGRVESAEILQSVHPVYDQAILRAAREWLYQPARRNDVAVPADITVEINLRPAE